MSRARTGSGKSAAFIIPLIHKILRRKQVRLFVTFLRSKVLEPFSGYWKTSVASGHIDTNEGISGPSSIAGVGTVQLLLERDHLYRFSSVEREASSDVSRILNGWLIETDGPLWFQVFLPARHCSFNANETDTASEVGRYPRYKRTIGIPCRRRSRSDVLSWIRSGYEGATAVSAFLSDLFIHAPCKSWFFTDIYRGCIKPF